MAPEILEGTEHYSAAIDVHSYGILMWSVLADGEVPYLEYNFKNALVMQNAIVEGTRPMIKDGTLKELEDLMTKCWTKEPEERPTFEEIITILESLSLNSTD